MPQNDVISDLFEVIAGVVGSRDRKSRKTQVIKDGDSE